KDDAVTEGDIAVLKDAELQCTRSGQVLEDFKGISAFQLNAEAADELARQRAKAGRGREVLLKEVRELLAIPEAVKPADRVQGQEVQGAGCRIFKMTFRTEPGIDVPALHFVPEKNGKNQPLILYLHGAGKSAEAGPGGAIEKLVKEGRSVLALDVRGFGETAAAALPKTPGQFGVDFKETFLALHLNRPLVGQRVFDLLAVLESLGGETK